MVPSISRPSMNQYSTNPTVRSDIILPVSSVIVTAVPTVPTVPVIPAQSSTSGVEKLIREFMSREFERWCSFKFGLKPSSKDALIMFGFTAGGNIRADLFNYPPVMYVSSVAPVKQFRFYFA